MVGPSLSMKDTDGLPGTPTPKVPGPGVRTDRANVFDVPDAFTAANEKMLSRQVAPVGSDAVNGTPSTLALIEPFDVVAPGGDPPGVVGMFSSNFRSPHPNNSTATTIALSERIEPPAFD